MATERKDFFINMRDTSGGGKGTGVKFAWKGTKEAYPEDIAKELGITEAKDNEPGLIYGMNKPRPARVYINVKLSGGKHKAFLVFADPLKIAPLLIKNSIKGKNYRGGTITSVGMPKTGTNPTRKKKDSGTKTPTKKPPTKKPPTKKPPTKKPPTKRR